MEVAIKNSECAKQKADCLIVGVFKDELIGCAANSLPSMAQEKIVAALKAKMIKGKCGETLYLGKLEEVTADNVIIVGLGAEGKVSRDNYIKANNSAYRACLNLNFTEIANSLCLESVEECSLNWKVRQSSFSAANANYHFEMCKGKNDNTPTKIRKVSLVLAIDEKTAETKSAAAQGLALAEGISLTRTLGNLPGNICTPSYLADQAEDLAKKWKMKCTILDKKDMEKLGMGSFLSVAQGSPQPPKMITLEYHGGKKGVAPIVLVGKGITFDSGGISLKPGAEMDEMKFDMCGAASVFGTLRAIAEMKLAINVVGIIPATENMPSGTATRPGDIVTSMSGQTIEILNTDAEGRLILCDALTYAAKYKPEMVIDIATLTGACVVALGHVAAGLYANQQYLADELIAASKISEDRVWQMPLWEDYQELLDSNFADIANIGGRWGGSITAACFLARFTKEYTWAHLDIAGVAWKSGKDKGATGRPVSLLTHFLLEKAGVAI